MWKHKELEIKYFGYDDGYIALAAAILLEAIDDYHDAVKNNQNRKIKALEKFFLSKYGQILSFDHGEYIIERLRNESD